MDLTRTTPDLDHHLAAPRPGGPGLGSGALYDEDSLTEMRGAGVTLHWIGMRRQPAHPANLLSTVRLRRLVGRLRPDVVHAHTSIAGALVRVTCALGAPPVVYTPHALVPPGIYRGIERILGPLTYRLVAVSESEADEIRRLGLVSEDRLVVVPNGIDLDAPKADVDLRTTLGIPAGTALVGTAMRLVPQKAPLDFVRACTRLAALRPETHFVLIGTGPLQLEVDEQVRRAGLATRWHQIEHLTGAAAALAQLDVFMLTSRFEGGPYTPLEAMRGGTPVVLTDVVGNRDVVEDRVSGLLVEFGKPDAAAQAAARLLDDSNLRKVLVAGARRRLEQKFDLDAMGAAYRHLYEDVVRLSTRRLPQPSDPSSANWPDARASR